MIHVLFICHGNICRSPMAEFLFKNMLEKKGLSHAFYVESAATSREEIGNAVYPPAQKRLAKEGISCKGKTARQVTKSDYANFDYLLVAERYNIPNLMRIIGDDCDKKVFRLLDFTTHPADIADPWYSGDFEATYQDITAGLDAFLAFALSR